MADFNTQNDNKIASNGQFNFWKTFNRPTHVGNLNLPKVNINIASGYVLQVINTTDGHTVTLKFSSALTNCNCNCNC
jgi:hypothetical protein